MALMLRPTGLRTSAAFAHLADWCVYDDGESIGRIYETHAPFRRELAWFWALHLMGPARGRVRTDGNAPTFEDAKAEFAAAREAFLAWRLQP
jgi:hypothetical protein